jgi:hypothetical protein
MLKLYQHKSSYSPMLIQLLPCHQSQTYSLLKHYMVHKSNFLAHYVGATCCWWLVGSNSWDGGSQKQKSVQWWTKPFTEIAYVTCTCYNFWLVQAADLQIPCQIDLWLLYSLHLVWLSLDSNSASEHQNALECIWRVLSKSIFGGVQQLYLLILKGQPVSNWHNASPWRSLVNDSESQIIANGYAKLWQKTWLGDAWQVGTVKWRD